MVDVHMNPWYWAFLHSRPLLPTDILPTNRRAQGNGLSIRISVKLRLQYKSGDCMCGLGA